MKHLSREVRTQFVDFWRSRDHRVIKSAPLVPKEDPTLLFTSAGMVQFKKYYSSKEPLEFRRAVTVQKCLRASDLEDVGFTPRHGTFFEMLGHFSFGDYFKREAILWNWEFFTKVLKLPIELLRPSVFEEDEEAFAIWRDEIGIPAADIYRLGRKDNFWGPAGDTGACGPSSELYFDLGAGLGCGREGCGPGCDCHRWVEIGNFVFPQFDRQADGSDLPLPNRGIDTGIGLERLTMVLAGKKTIFETDLFTPLIEKLISLGAASYEGDRKSAHHIIADHTRALVFALTEGILPSNEGRGYLIRRLLRRAAVQGHRLGLRKPFLHRLLETVVHEMGPVYPELKEAKESVRVTLQSEEERFEATLEQGLARFEEIAARRQSGAIPGSDLFLLYDTYGFPPDLTAVLAHERGLSIDAAGFEKEMEQQRERSRAGATFYRAQGDLLEWSTLSDGPHSRFVGYETLENDATVRRVAPVPDSKNHWWVIVDSTPFYAESGGQAGDTGAIAGPGLSGVVLDTVRAGDETRHKVRIDSGAWPVATVRLAVDQTARDATRRNHTATHLLHAALRLHLGKHVTQAGSLVAPQRLRFDFTHTGAMTEAELEAIEQTVNDEIMKDSPVELRVSSYDEAISDGVMALFGEKYDEEVRRIKVPGFSEELCGGTHVGRTGQIGSFVILSEAGIAAGVRRIEALTGRGAVGVRLREKRLLESLRRQIQATPEELPTRLQGLLDENQKLKKEVAQLRKGGSRDDLAEIWDGVATLPGGRLIVAEMTVESTDGIREMGDRLRDRLATGVGLLAVRCGEKTTLLAVVTDDLVKDGRIKADAIVRDAARLAGGSGGGRPQLAMAGVADPDKVPGLLTTMRERLASLLSA
jgi:alanyl-tRNA synthetase